MRGLTQGVRYQSIDQAWVNFGHQESHDIFIQLAGPIEGCELAAIHVEVGNPVSAFVVAIDRIRQLAFFPQSAH